MEPLSDFVKAWRSRQGISGTKAASLLDMSSRTLEGIEQGRSFSYERMMRLAIERLEIGDGDAS